MALVDGGSSSSSSSGPARNRAGVPSPCLMIYPLPSIADESFLQTVFRGKVGRSLFAGFAKGRFALLELTDQAMLHKVVQLVEKRDAATAQLALPEAARQPLVESTVASAGAEAVEETLGAWLAEVKAEDLTLADLFARHEGNATVDALGGDRTSVEYLLNLSWRGLYPLFVVVSPVTVEELHTCGGVVPERKAGRAAGPPRVGPPPPPGGEEGKGSVNAAVKADKPATVSFPKDCCQKCGSREHFTRKCDGSGPSQAAAPAAESAPSAGKRPRVEAAAEQATPTFPKDCCQKCGSREHFTRKCDGSGPSQAATPAIVSESTPTESRRPRREDAAAAAAAAAPAPTAPAAATFPKDCCQKCGSREHFTRKCDGSGPSQAAIPAAESAPSAVPVVKKAHGSGGPTRPAASAPAPAPVAAARPVFPRTSKDQCKFCGSDSHLSRHCPNK